MVLGCITNLNASTRRLKSDVFWPDKIIWRVLHISKQKNYKYWRQHMLRLMWTFYILQQKSAVSNIGQITALRFVDVNPVRSSICSKYFISSTQLAKRYLVWIGRHRIPRQQERHHREHWLKLILSQPEAGRNRENSPIYGQRSLFEDCRWPA